MMGKLKGGIKVPLKRSALNANFLACRCLLGRSNWAYIGLRYLVEWPGPPVRILQDLAWPEPAGLCRLRLGCLIGQPGMDRVSAEQGNTLSEAWHGMTTNLCANIG